MSLTVSGYKTGLDKGNAYWMAKISKEIYLTRSDKDQHPDEQKILANLKEEDQKFIKVIGANKNSAQAALVEHENFYCIVFRGTNQFVDWFDNFNLFPVQELFGGFHRGFWNSVEDVWDIVFSAYKTANAAHKKPLFFTGHSLGGAMATVASAKLIHLGLPFISTYTFGQPRVLTRDTARIFDVEGKSRFYRFHNNNDLVTRLPSRSMGYRHVGTYLYISEEKMIYEEAGRWFRFLDFVDGAFAAVKEKGLDGIEDHQMDEYFEGIKKWDLKS